MKKLLAIKNTATTIMLLVGCETTTQSKQINSDQFVLCDVAESEDDWSCGSNPEHGLEETCFAIGRSIVGIERLPNKALIVTCGEPLRSASRPTPDPAPGG